MDIKELEIIEVSPKILCEILDFENSNYLSELVKDHGFVRAAHGKYPLVKNIKRKIEYQKELHQDEIKKIREQESTRTRLERVQAEIKELELAEKKLSLIPVTDLDIVMTNQAQIYIKSLNALKTKLVPLLVHATTEAEIFKIIETETDKISEQLSDIPAGLPAESVKFE